MKDKELKIKVDGFNLLNKEIVGELNERQEQNVGSILGKSPLFCDCAIQELVSTFVTSFDDEGEPFPVLLCQRCIHCGREEVEEKVIVK